LGAVLLIVSTRGEVPEEGRFAGVSGNANTLAMCLFVTAFFVWCSPVKLPWWLHWCVAIFPIYAVLFTGSRKSIIMLAAAAVLGLVYLTPRLRDRKTWIQIGVIVLLVTPVLAMADLNRLGLWDTLSETATFSRSEQSLHRQRPEIRQELVERAMEIWAQSPVVGHGAGQYAVLSGFGVYSHNNYTELLANFGLVGLVLYYSLHAGVLAYAVPGAFRGSARRQAAIVLLVLILALDMASVSFSSKLEWVFLAAVMWLATAEESAPPRAMLPRASAAPVR
jgi:O-antigen ligase